MLGKKLHPLLLLSVVLTVNLACLQYYEEYLKNVGNRYQYICKHAFGREYLSVYLSIPVSMHYLFPASDLTGFKVCMLDANFGKTLQYNQIFISPLKVF